MNRNVTRVKQDYEKEVLTLRKVVDETAKDKSKLENENGSLKSINDDIKAK